MKRLAFVLAAVLATNAFAGSTVVAKKAALSTISPYATRIGLGVLREGGNAADAAIAVAFALAVAHPQAGNIGGGGFLVYFDAGSGSVWTLDFREVAPAAAKRDMYDASAESSRTGPLASGVPGTLAGLDAIHRRFGSLPWKSLLAPAIALARDGVRTDETLASDLEEAAGKRHIEQFPATAALFFPGGKPIPAGSLLVQPELAATLERIAQSGAREFYDGPTGEQFVKAMREAGGILTSRDLHDYAPVWRAPIQIHFGDYEIFTMAPPAAGGLVLAEALNILSGYDLREAGFQTPQALHLIAESARRASIDRNKYLGDPSTTRIPYRELVSAERAALWRSSINVSRATPTAGLAEPNAGLVTESDHTTHFTIADAGGNIVSLTTTLNDDFGSGFVVPGLGFFVNDEMDDFTPGPGKPNRYGLVQGIGNTIEPSKRMASSMSPVIVLRGGRPFLALGTRGGPTIPTSVLQVLLGILLYGKTLEEAVAAPRYHHQATPDEIAYELGRAPQATVDALNAMGHPVVPRKAIGDVHALMFEKGTIIAVADPRNGGAAGGF